MYGTKTTTMTGTTMKKSNNGIEVFQFDRLGRPEGITHFITTRHGGVSIGNYRSMSLGVFCEDDPLAVSENRRRLCEAMEIPEGHLVVPHQIHGDILRVIDHSFLSLPTEEQQAFIDGTDALITYEPDICIGVTTADCVPVLIYAQDKKIVAAIHAGWRGTVQQIVSKTIKFLNSQFGCDAKYMLAGIGPAIGVEAYPVGEDVVSQFASSGLNLDFFVKRDTATGKPHVDLCEANRQQLLDCGLESENIEVAGLCTYARSDDFFSARRSGIRSGRMLSCIMLKKEKI